MDRCATIVTSRLTLLLFAGACVHSAPPVLSVQYTPRSAVADTAPSLRQPSDDAADVLGWPRFNRVTLPAGTRELRLSDWYSMMAGTAVPIVRLIEQPGRAPEGQLVMVAARRFGDLGAWDMTAPCVTRNEATADAGDLYIRRLQGSRDDRYHCNAPSRDRRRTGRLSPISIHWRSGIYGRVGRACGSATRQRRSDRRDGVRAAAHHVRAAVADGRADRPRLVHAWLEVVSG
jgi:hypothetical protein